MTLYAVEAFIGIEARNRDDALERVEAMLGSAHLAETYGITDGWATRLAREIPDAPSDDADILFELVDTD